jgi:hypothetical protein
MVITLFNENVYVNVTWLSSLNCIWLITLFNENVYVNVTWVDE